MPAALHPACHAGEIGSVELLLRAGCDINVENAVGETAADLATTAGYRDDLIDALRRTVQQPHPQIVRTSTFEADEVTVAQEIAAEADADKIVRDGLTADVGYQMQMEQKLATMEANFQRAADVAALEARGREAQVRYPFIFTFTCLYSG